MKLLMMSLINSRAANKAKARSHKVFSLHICTSLLVLLSSPSFFDAVFLQLDCEVDALAVNTPPLIPAALTLSCTREIF